METIRSLLDQIASTKKAAGASLGSVDFRMRQGFAMRKTQAKEELPRLYKRLQDSLVPSKLVCVVATGDTEVGAKVAEFVAANGGIALDAAAMYERIAARIEPSFGPRRHYAENQFMGTKLEAEKISDEVEGPVVQFKFKTAYTKTPAEVVAHVRDLIRGSMADVLNASYLSRAAMDQVVTKDLADESDRLPVVLTGTLPQERAALRRLFAKSIEFEFPTDFPVAGDKIVAVFKQAT